MASFLKETFRVHVDLGPAHHVGHVNGGTLRVIPIIGGTMAGDLINGEVVAVGADWNLARDDGMVFLSARYLLKTDDGALISILNEGWGRQSDAVMASIMRGEAMNADGWYCKTHPRFEVADERYQWLTRGVFVSEMLPPAGADAVDLIFYEIG